MIPGEWYAHSPRHKVCKKESTFLNYWKGFCRTVLMFCLIAIYTVVFYCVEIAGEAFVGHALEGNQFLIQEVVLNNNVFVDRSEILQVIRLKPDENLLTCSLKQVRQKVEELPNVKKAVVKRIFPGTLSISLLESTPRMRLIIGGELLDQEGQVVHLENGFHNYPHLPILGGLHLTSFDALAIEDIPRYESILDLLEAFNFTIPPGGNAIVRVQSDPRWLDVTLESGAVVRFPVEECMAELPRLKVVMKDLKRRGRKASLIDLRFKDVVVT